MSESSGTRDRPEAATRTLSLEQAAAFLHIHPSTLRARAAAGIVRGYKPGRAWVFLEDDLLAYLETTGPAPLAPIEPLAGKALGAADRLEKRLARRRSRRP